MSLARLPVVVLCAGGHAKVIIDALALMGTKILGIVDIDPQLTGKSVLGFPVLGGEEVLQGYGPEGILLANGLGGARSMVPRKGLFDRFREAGYRFITVVHPSAAIAREVALSEGVQVMAGAVIQTGTTIGDDTIINTRASVDHDCTVGRHVHIAPGVTVCGGVEIGDGAYIGSGSTITPGVTIGRGVLVRTGSSVTEDVAGWQENSGPDKGRS